MLPFAAIDLTAVVVTILAGGLFTGIVALLRYQPERDQVVVTSAQGAVVVQSGVIAALREELKRVGEELRLARLECAEEKQRRITAERRVRELEGDHARGDG